MRIFAITIVSYWKYSILHEKNPTDKLFAHIVVLERALLSLRFSVKLKLEENIVKCSYEISANSKVTGYANTRAPLLVDFYCPGFRPKETKRNKETKISETLNSSCNYEKHWILPTQRRLTEFLAKKHTAQARLHAFVKWKYNRIKENVKLKCWC